MRSNLLPVLLAALFFSSPVMAADAIDIDLLAKQLKTKVDPKGHGDAAYTLSMHDRLISWLPSLDPNDRLDGELLANARAFAEGDINAKVFMLYLREAHLKPLKRRIRLLDLAVKAGEADSMLELARMHLNGDGVKLDLEKGREWLLRSIAAGAGPEARNLLGDLYRLGLGGLARNDDEAVVNYQMSARMGSPWGMLKLGEAVSEGRGVKADKAEAKRLFEAARAAAEKGAEEGDLESMYVLGYLLADDGGKGLTTDYETALKWYRKAAAGGHAGAMNAIAYFHHMGLGVEKDPKQAIRWWQKAAELKQVDAIQWLARVYREGLGVGRDYAMTMKYYLQAVELGSAFSMNEVGYLYDAGLGVNVDYERAMSWYLKAAAKNHAMGTSNVGMLHAFGKGQPRDVTEAMKWWLKAAELGAAPAMFALAEQYHTGEVVEKDEAEAIKWMRRAAEGGHAQAIEWLKQGVSDQVP